MCIADDVFIFSIVPLFYTIFLDSNITLGYIIAFILYVLLSCFLNNNMSRKYKNTYFVINILISPIFFYLSIIFTIFTVDKLNINNDFLFRIIVFVPIGLILILSTKYITKYFFHCCIEEP